MDFISKNTLLNEDDEETGEEEISEEETNKEEDSY